jgi:hypothetical protein
MTVCGWRNAFGIRGAAKGDNERPRRSSFDHQSQIGEGMLCDNLKNYD